MQKLITERQTREKTLPRRRKKEKKIKNIFKAIEAEDNDDEVDSQNEDEDDKEHLNEMLASVDAETKEAVMVRPSFDCQFNSTKNTFHTFKILQREKEVTSQLAKKLSELEGQLVRGGRNILDTYTERQLELEKKLTEIAERKKREVEMQQQLELQEETTLEIRDTLTSVQQEVELKTRKLKKCYTKYMVS